MNVIARILLLLLAATSFATAAQKPVLRPPAVPLVAHDPYLSIWSPRNEPSQSDTMHWTATRHPLRCIVRINNQPFRLIGAEPDSLPTLRQTRVSVLPTRSIYEFTNQHVRLTLTFLTPALPSDLDILSRPLTYVIWEAESLDVNRHLVEVYFEVGPELVVRKSDQAVRAEVVDLPGLQVRRMGTVDQPILENSGDKVCIDWGYAYVAAPASPATQIVALPRDRARQQFIENGRLPFLDEDLNPSSPAQGAPGIVGLISLGKVGSRQYRGTAHVMLAYDDEFSILYFGDQLRPYWRRHGMDAQLLIQRAHADLGDLLKRCEKFDEEFMKDMTRVGGEEYALMAALAYRQTLAACKLAADAEGAPLLFPKENDSNGCMGTVDVIYPMIPFTYLFSPALAKAVLVPVLDYAQSPRWTFPFAPHDLGRYPHALGQVYGGGEKTLENQMPVEESANMILLLAGLAEVEGNADFAGRYWPLLEKWAAYLVEAGWNPGEQLCTDDFAGPLAGNVNLSAKAICALGAYAQLLDTRGDKAGAKEWRKLALDWVDQWLDAAYETDHYRLAFDKPGTWSQKYNLVWDQFLDLKLFPSHVVRDEMELYLKHQQKYGLPLDSRDTFTKLDWIVWTSCLTGKRSDMDALLQPVFKFLNETPDRVPMTDWYFTDTGRRRGFMARPVVGGVFMPAILNSRTLSKWSERGEDYERDWAAFPVQPEETAPAETGAPPAQEQPAADTPLPE